MTAHGTETDYGRQLRESHEAWEAELAAHTCEQHTCIYCGTPGLAEHFEQVNGRSWACRQGELCTLRQLTAEGDPVPLVLQLARELAQVARDDRAAAGHLADPWGRHQAATRPHRTLSTRDLARLHVVLTAAAGWLNDSGSASWGQELAQARADLGCRRCGAMGPDMPCTTAQGTERRDWHAGRRF